MLLFIDLFRFCARSTELYLSIIVEFKLKENLSNLRFFLMERIHLNTFSERKDTNSETIFI